jgi:O-antigen/teichoic acid export membrane protein
MLADPLARDLVKLTRNATLIFAARVTGAVTVFLTQVLLARWAGPQELGVYVYGFAWCVLLATMAGLGFPVAAFRFLGRALAHGQQGSVRGFIRRGRQIAVIAGFAIALSGVGITLAVGDLMPSDRRQVLLLALACVPVYALIGLNSGAAHGLSWFRVAFVPDLVIRPVLLLAAMAAMQLSGMPVSATAVMALHAGIMLVVMAGQHRIVSTNLDRHFPVADNRSDTGAWMRSAIPLLVISLFTNYFVDLNLIVVGMHVGAEDLGIFNAAYRTAFLIGFGIYAVDAIVIPRAAQLHASGDTVGLQRIVDESGRLRMWVSVAAVLLLAVLGDRVLALFGEKFVEAYWPLMILALAQLVTAAFGPVTQLLSISGYHRHCLYVFFFSLIAMTSLHALMIPRFGLHGAAVSVVLVVLLQSAWLYAIVARRLGIRASVLAWRRVPDPDGPT